VVNSEPLLDRDVAGKVARLKEAGIRNTFISTNGSLLDESRGEALLQAGIDTVYISIDSLKADVFERIRCRLKFETVYRNALRFIETRGHIRPRARIRICMVLQEDNAGEVDDFVAHWRERLCPGDEIVVTRLYDWGRAQRTVAPLPEPETPEDRSPCISLWTALPVDAGGEAFLCCKDAGLTRILGDVREQSIREIWQGEPLAAYRALHMRGERRRLPMCDGCRIWQEQKHVRYVKL
jgi:MoaA/NifB/PqqE/SkfB family radical SAM enzyme